MSASLVGSEMCIRDSVSPRAGVSVRILCARGWWPAVVRACRACHSLPVSYTHLTLPTICSV
eukprot:10630688-Alexandrium_andersonii.AAC.1